MPPRAGGSGSGPSLLPPSRPPTVAAGPRIDWRFRPDDAFRRHAVTKYVYDFSEGNKDMKDLLGGKGANLAEMTNMGLPVPHGFTITTEACLTYLAEGGHPAGPDGRGGQSTWRRLEASMGKTLGDAGDPAARQRALGRQVLDAGDDGHRLEPRAERGLGRGARGPDRRRPAVRARRLPAVHPDVRQDRDGRARRRVRARARRGQGRRRARTRRTPIWTPTTCRR